MAHRYLIAAALSEGESVIEGVEYSKDILATIDCLRALGIHIECEESAVTVRGGAFSLQGELNCCESGSTLRFLLPLCLLLGAPATLKGSLRLMERPLSVYRELCAQNGFEFSQTQEGITVCGRLTRGEYSLDGGISSQFVSGMLFALACCEGESIITLNGKIESRSYIDLTLLALRKFGYFVEWSGERTLRILGGKGKAQNLRVEGDYSNAAFLDAFNLIGGKVTVGGLDPASLQGDRIYYNYFIEIAEGVPTLSLADCPDLGPVLMAASAVKNGAKFTETARLKIKESDRGAAMAEELQKCGVEVTLLENEIIVSGGATAPRSAIAGHNDHRIVMAMALLCSKFGGTIDGAEAVAKSYPAYFEKIKSLGIEVDIFEAE
jgi:3-phosphoshikimate 1-carboxyvinyltransferase